MEVFQFLYHAVMMTSETVILLFCLYEKKTKLIRFVGASPKSKLQIIQASSLANFILSQHFNIILFSVLKLQEAKAL